MASPASDRCCGGAEGLAHTHHQASPSGGSGGEHAAHLDAGEFNCYICYELLLDPVVGACAGAAAHFGPHEREAALSARFLLAFFLAAAACPRAPRAPRPSLRARRDGSRVLDN